MMGLESRLAEQRGRDKKTSCSEGPPQTPISRGLVVLCILMYKLYHFAFIRLVAVDMFGTLGPILFGKRPVEALN